LLPPPPLPAVSGLPTPSPRASDGAMSPRGMPRSGSGGSLSRRVSFAPSMGIFVRRPSACPCRCGVLVVDVGVLSG
jgi:hypothetical protein